MVRVSFTLDQSMKNELSARAGGQGMSAYIRRILQREWGREDQLYEMEASMAALTAQLGRVGANSQRGGDQMTRGALFEMLLLLRALAGPSRLRGAQAEVERVGLPVWESSMFEAGDGDR